MRPQEIQNAVRSFLYLVEKGTGSVEGNEKMLSLMVDRLAVASHYRIYTLNDRELPTPPDHDNDDLHNLVAERFPNYGYYNSPEHIVRNVANTRCLVGDAIDDIVDVAVDLYDVEWYWCNVSDRSALRYFEIRYRENWGIRLRQLQLYIFADTGQKRASVV